MSVDVRCSVLGLALAALACSIPAARAAASGSDPAAAPATAQRLFGDKTELVLGLSSLVTPDYDGSARDHWEPLPVVSVQRGILFADSTRGAGLQFQSGAGLYLSQSIYYDFGRVDHDSRWRPGSRTLAGMGQVPDAFTTRTLVAQTFAPWFMASAEAEFSLRDGARRDRYRAGVEFTPLQGGADEISLDLDGHWGDRRYNQAYFGVTAQQSARSGFAAYPPGAGLYAASGAIEWDHIFSPHWSTMVQLTGTRYLDQAGASPVVERRFGTEATLALIYAH